MTKEEKRKNKQNNEQKYIRDPSIPEHLAGHEGKVWEDSGIVEYFVKNYNIKTAIDIGAGPGNQISILQKYGVRAIGIDGDPTISHKDIQIHDYNMGPINKSNIMFLPKCGYFDLAHSVEFVEHVDRKYTDNYMQTFKLAKYVVMTHSLTTGYHHVTVEPFSYWQKVFANYNFKASAIMTSDVRRISTMRRKLKEHVYTFEGDDIVCSVVRKSFMEKNGFVFVNQDLI